MNHPSDDQLYNLAGKIAAEEDFTPEEAEAMGHIAECDSCYHMLCCLMAMQDVAQHIGGLAGDTAAVPVSLGETISAVIRLAVNAVNTALHQQEAGPWTFRSVPLALAGARSLGKHSANAAKKLTDAKNSQTFVAYAPEQKRLMIQIDSADCQDTPCAFLLLPTGEKTEVPFEKREDLFWAEVQGLQDGEYEIILEK